MLLGLLLGVHFPVHAQEAGNDDGQQANGAQKPTAQDQSPDAASSTRVTIHGTVLNSSTGEPVARALVAVEGDASLAMLTDGEGHFEFDGITTGEHVISVKKPGYRGGENLDGDVVADVPGGEGVNRGVVVVDQTPELVFKLTPNAAIRGHVELSTGDPAEGILLQLTEQRVFNGRASWTVVDTTTTNSSGNYRFSGLAAGTYLVKTMPSMEAESLAVAAPVADTPRLAQSGYASTYYPEARDLAGAGRIEVRAGEEVQANIFLRLESFQPVVVKVLHAADAASDSSAQMRSAGTELISLTDESGNPLQYASDYNKSKREITASLPDGSYILSLASMDSLGASLDSASHIRMGSVSFTVEGHAVENLRMATAPLQPLTVHIRQPDSTLRQAGAGRTGAPPVFVSFTSSDGPAPDLTTIGSATPDLIAFMSGIAGRYWANATTERAGVCVGPFTAGGADLAREPLVLSPSSTPPAMELTLRDDCAKLNLTLPYGAAIEAPGVQTTYTVYVVPDFETTSTVTPSTMRAGSGATVTLESLTPGSYHIYVFTEPVELEYHNPAALQNLSGQQITIAPSSSNDLMLEVPQP